MAQPCTQICCGCFVLSILTFLILIIISFASLEVNEYGLDYSSISKTVKKKKKNLMKIKSMVFMLYFKKNNNS